jgi:hypothetical protein
MVSSGVAGKAHDMHTKKLRQFLTRRTLGLRFDIIYHASESAPDFDKLQPPV